MSEIPGRVKEAAGDLTDNKDLQREGQTEQAGDKAKQGIDKAVDKVKDFLHKGDDDRR
ncbi:MAG: CsbD family protein [Solirubrobacterales bacterium]